MSLLALSSSISFSCLKMPISEGNNWLSLLNDSIIIYKKEIIKNKSNNKAIEEIVPYNS